MSASVFLKIGEDFCGYLIPRKAAEHPGTEQIHCTGAEMAKRFPGLLISDFKMKKKKSPVELLISFFFFFFCFVETLET